MFFEISHISEFCWSLWSYNIFLCVLQSFFYFSFLINHLGDALYFLLHEWGGTLVEILLFLWCLVIRLIFTILFSHHHYTSIHVIALAVIDSHYLYQGFGKLQSNGQMWSTSYFGNGVLLECSHTCFCTDYLWLLLGYSGGGGSEDKLCDL